MTAEKFKRSIHTLMGMWQEWSTFSAKAHQDFLDVFDNPPLTDEEQQAEVRKNEEKKAAEEEKETNPARGIRFTTSCLRREYTKKLSSFDLDLESAESGAVVQRKSKYLTQYPQGDDMTRARYRYSGWGV